MNWSPEHKAESREHRDQSGELKPECPERINLFEEFDCLTKGLLINKIYKLFDLMV
jgi:hypothetical protein